MVRHTKSSKNANDGSGIKPILSMLDYIKPEVESIDQVASYFIEAARSLLHARADLTSQCIRCGAIIKGNGSQAEK